jgi:hypothetical protein
MANFTPKLLQAQVAATTADLQTNLSGAVAILGGDAYSPSGTPVGFNGNLSGANFRPGCIGNATKQEPYSLLPVQFHFYSPGLQSFSLVRLPSEIASGDWVLASASMAYAALTATSGSPASISGSISLAARRDGDAAWNELLSPTLHAFASLAPRTLTLPAVSAGSVAAHRGGTLRAGVTVTAVNGAAVVGGRALGMVVTAFFKVKHSR